MASGASLQSMIQAVQKKKKQLEALPEGAVSKMADVLVLELEARTPGPEDNPLNTGTLKKALTKRTKAYKAGDYWKVGVGDLSKLQSWHAAPKGTIAAFLADFMPAYKAEQAKSRQEAEKLRADRVEAERQRIEAAKQERAAERQARWADQLQKASARFWDIFADYREQVRAISRLIDSVDAQAKKIEKLRTYGKRTKPETKARLEASRQRRLDKLGERYNEYWKRYRLAYYHMTKSWDYLAEFLTRIGAEKLLQQIRDAEDIPAQRRKRKWRY